MWHREYKDYPIDAGLKQQKVESGKGIVGCEMHDAMGWGESHHRAKRQKPGLMRTLLAALFRTSLKDDV